MPTRFEIDNREPATEVGKGKLGRSFKRTSVFRALFLGTLALTLLVQQTSSISARPAGDPQGTNELSEASGVEHSGRQIYIAQLKGPSALGEIRTSRLLKSESASHKAKRMTFEADERFEISSTTAQNALQRIEGEQRGLMSSIASIAPGATRLQSYRIALNGLSLSLSEAEAEQIEKLPGVLRISKAEKVMPLLDTSLDQIRASAAWSDPRIAGRADAGRGVRIAVIDSGITAEHPFFSDAGFDAPEGFPKASLSIGEDVMQYAPPDRSRFTNKKVIVARAYVNPELIDPEDENPLETYTPLADGFGGFHGAHVAGIAAGSVSMGAPGSTSGGLELSGVAPGAYLMSYKFTNAYTSEILQMIDDAIADGADVINNSWGTSAMNVLPPAHHPVAQAFKEAHDAGIVVVAAAGNAGTNGESTLGGPHQMIDEVITVANVQTGRSFSFNLYAADQGLTDTLKVHPTVYVPFENDFNTLELPAARLDDFCDLASLAIGARGTIPLESMTGSCEIPGVDLPIQIPDQFGFVTKILMAGVLNASSPLGRSVEGVVFYAPSGSPADSAQLLDLMDLAAPFLEQSGLEADYPIVSFITGPEAMALVDWADDPANAPLSLQLKMDPTPISTHDPSLDNAANLTSSQGPAVTGISGQRAFKPNLSAPGTDTLSTSTNIEGAPDGYTVASGTSMASPMVAGAAAVVLQAHPDWSPADVKSALMTTAAATVTVAGDSAPLTVQGSGRINVEAAINASALIQPPAVNLDLAAADIDNSPSIDLIIQDARPAADATADLVFNLSQSGVDLVLDSTRLVDLSASAVITVPMQGELNLNLPVLSDEIGTDIAEGFIHFETTSGPAQHVALRIEPEIVDRKDVLLINIRSRSVEAGGGGIPGIPGIPGLPGGGGPSFEDTADYSGYWTDSLTAAGLSHDVWSIADADHDRLPPLRELQRYDMVILAAGASDAPLAQLSGGMTILQMYMLGGGRLLVSGYDWQHGLSAGEQLTLQNNGASYFISRYFGGFELIVDDVEPFGSRNFIGKRIFDGAFSLSDTNSATAAETGAQIDQGRPLLSLQTTVDADAGNPGAGAPPDLGIAAPGVVSRIMPYMHSVIEYRGGSVMTGVWPDATLEHPIRGEHIPWQALFAGFGIESMREDATLDRAMLLEQAHAWATESSEVEVSLSASTQTEVGEAVDLTASIELPDGVEIVSWRWDAGDGRGYQTTANPALKLFYFGPGTYTTRVEAMTATGHTFVAEQDVRIEGDWTTFGPIVTKNW